MLIINFIISLILIIIIFCILSSLTKSLLYFFTKYEYEAYYLLFPTFLILGSWSLCFILWYITITYFLKIDIIEVIISIIIKEGILPNNLISTSLIFIFIALLLQSIVLLTVNIDYKKITGDTRFLFKKLLKVRLKKNKNLVIKNDPDKISLGTTILITISSFVILIISLTILLLIGYIISKALI